MTISCGSVELFSVWSGGLTWWKCRWTSTTYQTWHRKFIWNARSGEGAWLAQAEVSFDRSKNFYFCPYCASQVHQVTLSDVIQPDPVEKIPFFEHQASISVKWRRNGVHTREVNSIWKGSINALDLSQQTLSVSGRARVSRYSSYDYFLIMFLTFLFTAVYSTAFVTFFSALCSLIVFIFYVPRYSCCLHSVLIAFNKYYFRTFSHHMFWQGVFTERR